MTPTSDLLALAPMAALEVDAHGTVLHANELALDLFATVDLQGRRLEPLLPLAGLLSGDAEHVRLDGRRANGVPVLVAPCASCSAVPPATSSAGATRS